MASVTYDHVSKRYSADVTAIRDLNLQVRDTEFMVLVGPSGCGKTTALRMLAGLEEITEGAIKIGDRVVNDVPARERDVAMVFQSYALYPHMSVYDNMAFGLRMRGVPKRQIDEKVRSTATMLGLEPSCNASHGSSPAASGSGWRWGGRSSVTPRSSSSTSRCRTWTRSSGWRPGSTSNACTASWGRRSSTSPTTRSRR